MGGVPREQKMLQGHLPRVIHHQVYSYTKTKAGSPLAFEQLLFTGVSTLDVFNDALSVLHAELQGYLAHEKHPPRRTLQ